MSRVEINAHGRHIIIDHTAELDTITDYALTLWQQTDTAPPNRPTKRTRNRLRHRTHTTVEPRPQTTHTRRHQHTQPSVLACRQHHTPQEDP